MKKLFLTILIILILAPIILADNLTNEPIILSKPETENQTTSLNSENQIKVGVYIINLGKFDVSTGAFTADFYLSLKCESVCSKQDFEFMNGRASSVDKIIDAPFEKFYRIQANLNSPVDLKKFPFDQQNIQIIIEDKKKTIEELEYIPDLEASGIDDSIAFTGWNIEDWKEERQIHT